MKQTESRTPCILGLLAHVDAGKTTLSEALLFQAGALRKMGRVDKQDAFLDTDQRERERGITIFSKQARFSYAVSPREGKGENGNVFDWFTSDNISNDSSKIVDVTLLDTPGHVDFSAEMERVLSVLDYAILLVSAADGVQGHTMTLWELLERYHIPTFLFVNKMDQPGMEKEAVLEEIHQRLGNGVVDFSILEEEPALFYENIAVCDENVLEYYLEQDQVPVDMIRQMIAERKLFPCYFGSALRMEGIEALLNGLTFFQKKKDYPEEFGARVFKIDWDEQGNRLTHLKLTGGSLSVKEILDTGGQSEKVNQLRKYSGTKFEMVQTAMAGQVISVTGLSRTYCGQALGMESEDIQAVLNPVLSYQLRLPEGIDAAALLPKLLRLGEEDPQLQIDWQEHSQKIQVKVMGQVQIEIIKSLIFERLGIDVEFENGTILYQETISNTVEGAGHFEPLRHYAEVHLLLEPLPQGSGLVFETDCREEILDKNWQRLILTHLTERRHKGVLTGAPITDMKITVIGGRAHIKHTEGGDFRQATYRAVRQGLKKAESVLLEPYYQFRIDLPEQQIGRAMSDFEQRFCSFALESTQNGRCTLTGQGPVVLLQDYQREVTEYTRGEGKLFLRMAGYAPCHNALEIIEKTGYDSEQDLANPTGSVFCAHGTSYTVSWDMADEKMHVQALRNQGMVDAEEEVVHRSSKEEQWLGTDEIDQILDRTFFSNSQESTKTRKEKQIKKNQTLVPDWQLISKQTESAKEKTDDKRTSQKSNQGSYQNSMGKAGQNLIKKAYLLVDGYNVLFHSGEMYAFALENMDAARTKLLDMLCDYQGYCQKELIVVFDAYRVEGHQTEIYDYHNIHVVYTKEAETADQYIERFAHDHGKCDDVTIATSDGLEQVIIRSKGCFLMSAGELYEDMELMKKAGRAHLEQRRDAKDKLRLGDAVSKEMAEKLEKMRRGTE